MDIWNTTDTPLSPPLLIDFQGMNQMDLKFAIWWGVRVTLAIISLSSYFIYSIASCIILTLWNQFFNFSLINNLGNIQRDLKLNFQKGTSVWDTCGTVLNGQHWLIGGRPDKRQVSYWPWFTTRKLRVKLGKYNNSY